MLQRPTRDVRVQFGSVGASCTNLLCWRIQWQFCKIFKARMECSEPETADRENGNQNPNHQNIRNDTSVCFIDYLGSCMLSAIFGGSWASFPNGLVALAQHSRGGRDFSLVWPIMQLRTLPRALSIASLSCKGTRNAVRLSTANCPKFTWQSCMRAQKLPVNQTKQIWHPLSRNVFDKCESDFFWSAGVSVVIFIHCSFGSWSRVSKQPEINLTILRSIW